LSYVLFDDIKDCVGANPMFLMQLITYLRLLINIKFLESRCWSCVVTCKIFVILSKAPIGCIYSRRYCANWKLWLL